MKYIRFVVSGIFILFSSACFMSTRPQVNNVPQEVIDQPLSELEQLVAQQNEGIVGLRPDNGSKIYWADSIRKTEYCLVYLHGFSASGMGADPMHRELARRYGMNLYIPRLFAHGITAEDAMLEFNAKDYIDSAKEAIAIAKKMGEKLIIMSCSTGSSLSLYLAAGDPDIIGLLLMSPNIRIANRAAFFLSGPWGLTFARLVHGSHFEWSHPNEEVGKYWTFRYRTEAIVQLQRFMKATMKKATFKQVKQPVFLGYYYKNKKEQDDVVSVAAMLKMFRQLGTPSELKEEIAFKEAATHTICSRWHSREIENLQNQLQEFIENVLRISPL